jgi:hypothetical protein
MTTCEGQNFIFSFTSLLTPHRTLVNTHKINKCAKLGSILLDVSREDDENIDCLWKRKLSFFYVSPELRITLRET